LVKYLFSFCAIVVGFATAAQAIVIDYDGSVPPNALSPNPLSFIIFSGTSYQISNGELTLSTAYNRGIWFGNGNHTGTYNVPWQVGTASEGNYLRLRAKLTPGSTEWSMYLYDRTYSVGFGINDNELTWGHANGGGSMPFDPTAYHVFEIWSKDGIVTYRLDESQVLYQGPAVPLSFGTGIFVIGDGSGSDISGVGSMVVDEMLYISQPQFEIPEPASAALIGLAGIAMIARRRR
jgi:hypothetical protein